MEHWTKLKILRHFMSSQVQHHEKACKAKATACLASPVIRLYLKKVFWQMSVLNGGPFYWDESTGRVKRQGNRKRLVHFYLNFAYAVMYTVFVVARCLQVQIRDDVSLPVKILMRFQAVYFCLPVVLLMAFVQNRYDIPALINGILDLARTAEEAYIVKGSRKPRVTRLFEFVFPAAYWSINSVTLILMIPVIASPALPYLLSSLMPNPSEISLLRAVCVFSLIYVECIFLGAAHGALFTVLLIGPTLIILLNGLSHDNCEVTAPTLRKFPHNLKMYERLQVLVAIYNDSCCGMIVPAAKLALVIIIMFCTYGAIRFEGILAGAMGILSLFCVTVLVIMFTCLSELHLLSSKLLRIWRAHRRQGANALWLRKRVKALRELKAILRSLYAVDRHMVGTMVMSTIEETVTFLYVNR